LNALEFALGAGKRTLHAALRLPETVEEGDLALSASDFVVDIGLAYFHASQFPLRDGHLLQVEEFGPGEGLPFGLEIVTKTVEFLAIFAGKDNGARTHAVTEGVQANGLLSLGCSGASGQLRIAAIGLDLFLSCHK